MARTIVMIHGMWGGGWCWEAYQGFFAKQGYHCMRPTLRFHDVEPGAPAHPRLGATSLLDYAADLEQEIKPLGEPPIVLGHSMGGLLAQILGSRGLARALVLLTPASPAGILAFTPSVIKSFRSGLMRWRFWRRPHRPTFAEAVYSMLHLLTVAQQREIYQKLVPESGRAASEIGFWMFDTKHAARVDESRVTCPVLVIAGTEDRITPASVVRQVARKYKAVSTYQEFPHHAHWVVGEPGWQDIAGHVAHWLDRLPAGARSETTHTV